jgi:dsRNA-specific ribonuclease
MLVYKSGQETRAALHSNATFSRLAEKLDILAVDREVLDALTQRTFGEGSSAPLKTHPQVKATGDLFETCIGAYFLEQGFEQLFEWVAELYAPLIATAKQTYLEK